MNIILYTLLGFIFSASYAQAAFDVSLSIEELDAMMPILETYALTSVIVVACVTSIVVLRSARKMKGGVFGTVLNFFGLGMVAVLAGYIMTNYPALISFNDNGLVAYVLFILGYVLMAVAATKLSSAIGGK